VTPLRLLIFGGTFDPPHLAHVVLPPLVAKELGCERIIYVPAAMNPLKTEQPTAPEHRLEMLRLAIRDIPNAEICTIELEREGPSYTVDTLTALRDRFGPDAELRLLLGADAALSFPRWREPQRILELATPAVMLRPPWDEPAWQRALRETYPADEAKHWRSWTVPAPQRDISGTEVRRRATGGEALEELLPEAVTAYIQEHGLYRHHEGMPQSG
jgi:nicotinate-nucleotide adenylyltransferase